MVATVGFVFIASSFWKWKVSVCLCSNDRTHVGDPKNLVETQPPGADRLLVVLRVESSGDPAPFVPLDELSLDIRHGPGVENTLEGGSESMSLVLLTMPLDLSRQARTGQALHSSPDQVLDRHWRKTTRADTIQFANH